MSTIMHPCFESKFIETSQVLKLKVAAPPKATEQVSWSFLESLSNISSNTKQATMEKESIYIHPLSKSTSSRLSDKSLQICTENLGCETGSFMMMDSNILSLSSDAHFTIQKQSLQQQQKVKHSYEFPPPLTTMSGEKPLSVKTHRENGRLIIKTVEKPLKESCFLADRSGGRLKLCFLKDVFTKVDMRMTPQENEAHEEEAEEMNKDDDDNQEFKNQENGADDEADENGDYNKEIMSKEYGNGSGGNSNNYDIEKFQRLKRCQECGNNNKKKLGNWEPLWVATS